MSVQQKLGKMVNLITKFLFQFHSEKEIIVSKDEEFTNVKIDRIPTLNAFSKEEL
jgi:hypothetical protein